MYLCCQFVGKGILRCFTETEYEKYLKKGVRKSRKWIEIGEKNIEKENR